MTSSPAASCTADPCRQAAAEAGLRYVSDTEPGITRQRCGKGFAYRLPDGSAVRDRDVVDRIRKLAIPPAYRDVWICTNPRGHLQATGRDDRNRKQYRYHPDWSEQRGDGKFERIVAFGEALPRLRRRVRADLKLPGYPRDKVLALVLAVMGETLLRVGNDQYARSNKSYGLTTLRNRHVAFAGGGRARFSFRGKSGLDHEVEVDDPQLVKLVRACQGLPGQALFQYRDDDGAVQPVDSGAVNEYLRAALGGDFTAKDFRTWGGTLRAFRAFAATPLPVGPTGIASERALRATEKAVIREVAADLGNTVAVCRRAYIDPSVLAGWRDGSLQRAAGDARGERQWEQAALRFLKGARRAAARLVRGRTQARKPAASATRTTSNGNGTTGRATPLLAGTATPAARPAAGVAPETATTARRRARPSPAPPRRGSPAAA